MDTPVKDEALLEAPEEEKLIPAHTGENGKKAPKSLIIVLITFSILWIIGLAAYIVSNHIRSNLDDISLGPVDKTEIQETVPPITEGIVACTMDAKLCPDGSSVGRSGPNCEFEKCPGE